MKIFVYVDQARFTESTCQYAQWAANRLGIGIELVHILPHLESEINRDYSGYLGINAPDIVVEDRIRRDEAYNRQQVNAGQEFLDDVAAQLRETGFQDVSRRLYLGSIANHLEEHAHEAVVAVIGNGGTGEDDLNYLRNTLEPMIRSERLPVMIVPERFTEITSATIAFGGGASSGGAIHYVATSGLFNEMPLTLLHVSDGEQVPMAIGDAREHLVAAGLQPGVETVSGDTADTILSEADETDLLIMGAYGHSRIRQMIMGSTTEKLLERADIPVLVV